MGNHHMSMPIVHRIEQPIAFPVNAYIVEGQDALVAIDATISVTGARAVRAKADSLGKPMVAGLVTHPHPDHYAGLSILFEGLDVPIFALREVSDVIARDDAMKNDIVGPMFRGEWPATRRFPDRIIQDGEEFGFGSDLQFKAIAFGPAESPFDSGFLVQGANAAFVGDIAYGLMHAYLADGHIAAWHAAIKRARATIPEDHILYIGHGGPVTPPFLAWQTWYLTAAEAAIRDADWSNAAAARESVMARVKSFLPADSLDFLLQLSIDPLVEKWRLHD
jgi:glyoxylase-like metal-dependent hydrolase (beta-lactamase superfamily II)